MKNKISEERKESINYHKGLGIKEIKTLTEWVDYLKLIAESLVMNVVETQDDEEDDQYDCTNHATFILIRGDEEIAEEESVGDIRQLHKLLRLSKNGDYILTEWYGYNGIENEEVVLLNMNK